MAVAVCQRWVGRIILTGGYYRYCALKGASFSLRLFSSSSTAAAHNIGFRYGDTTEGGEGAKEAATRHTRAKVERTSVLSLFLSKLPRSIKRYYTNFTPVLSRVRLASPRLRPVAPDATR